MKAGSVTCCQGQEKNTWNSHRVVITLVFPCRSSATGVMDLSAFSLLALIFKASVLVAEIALSWMGA